MSKNTPKTIEIDLTGYKTHQIGDILKDLDHIFETDSSMATLKFISPIYNHLMEIYHKEKQKPIIVTPTPIRNIDPDTHQYQLPDSENHTITSRRLQWKSDILENCDCALWVLWEMGYEFQQDEKDIPISKEKLAKLTKEYIEMSQEDRNEHRRYVADGLYDAEGVDIPCPTCGYQVEDEEDYE